jgi:hypothetical protein
MQKYISVNPLMSPFIHEIMHEGTTEVFLDQNSWKVSILKALQHEFKQVQSIVE